MTDYRTMIDDKAGSGARFELYQFARKNYALGLATDPAAIHVMPSVPTTMRQLRIVLDGSSALLEPGALQYAVGSLQVEVQKNDQGGIFA